MPTQNVAVVTGANKGIGYAIVKGLCEKFQGCVYLTSRNVEKGKASVSKLKELGLNPLYHQLDLNDRDSIKKFKDNIVKEHGGIDILINNAAICYSLKSIVSFGEQAENTIDVNYFGTLRVCEILFPILRNNARVVNVSSSAGHLSRIPSETIRRKFSDPSLTIESLSNLMKNFVRAAKENRNEAEGWGTKAYSVSKVGVIVLTIIQQRLFELEQPNRNISVNACHPGYVNTDMNHRGTLTIEEGAKAPLFLALEANFKGKYIWYDTTIIDWRASSTPPH